MVQSRISPHKEVAAARERREAQRRTFGRNQVFGLLILAALIVAWWLFHAQPGWLFHPGWWRF